MASETPRVESFVLRFVQDAPNGGASALNLPDSPQAQSSPNLVTGTRANWHAVVVHVQTNEEKNFTDFADAVAFIARYVPLGEFAFNVAEDERRKTEEDPPPPSPLGHLGA